MARYLAIATLCMGASPACPQPPSAEDRAAQAPLLELLEFLGEWQTEDGEWIDPESLVSSSGRPVTVDGGATPSNTDPDSVSPSGERGTRDE